MVNASKTFHALRKWQVVSEDVKQNRSRCPALRVPIPLSPPSAVVSLRVNEKPLILQKGCYCFI